MAATRQNVSDAVINALKKRDAKVKRQGTPTRKANGQFKRKPK